MTFWAFRRRGIPRKQAGGSTLRGELATTSGEVVSEVELALTLHWEWEKRQVVLFPWDHDPAGPVVNVARARG